MSEFLGLRWTRLAPETPENTPRISFDGLLCPYLHFSGVGVTWLDSQKSSAMEMFVKQLLREGELDRISATQLARATGVPAPYWRPTLLSFERAGLLSMCEAAPGEAGNKYFKPAWSNEASTEQGYAASRVLTRTRVTRELLYFPESNELLITSGGASDARDKFINAFAAPGNEWFRTSTKSSSEAKGLRAHLVDIARAAPPNGAEPGALDIDFDLTGSMPDIAPVKALAGFVRIKEDAALPFFTGFQFANHPGIDRAARHVRRNGMPPFPLNEIPGLAARVKEGLDFCQGEDFLCRAREAAPPDYSAYKTLCTDAPFSWRIESAEAATHALDVVFSGMRFRIRLRHQPKYSQQIS